MSVRVLARPGQFAQPENPAAWQDFQVEPDQLA
jgi:hypothetical protein